MFHIRFSLILLLLLTISTCKLTLLTSTYQPFVDCGGTVNPESSLIHGAEIQLLRMAFLSLNWTEGLDFIFQCLPDTDSLFSSFNEGSTANVGVLGGITITPERLSERYTFTQPTVAARLPLVYQNKPKGWFFRRGLSLSGWILIFTSTFVVAGVMYLLENRKSAYINMLYNVFCQFFLSPDYPLTNFSSKTSTFPFYIYGPNSGS